MRHYFWGIFLLASGIFLLIKHYFNLNVPTGRIIVGLFIVSLGLSILVGGFGMTDTNRLIFSSGRFDSSQVQKEYNVIFSSGTIDLTGISEEGQKVEINTVFGSTELIVPGDMQVVIKANAAFATTAFPNGSRLTFGEQVHRYEAKDKEKPELVIELNTVFGRTDVKIR